MLQTNSMCRNFARTTIKVVHEQCLTQKWPLIKGDSSIITSVYSFRMRTSHLFIFFFSYLISSFSAISAKSFSSVPTVLSESATPNAVVDSVLLYEAALEDEKSIEALRAGNYQIALVHLQQASKLYLQANDSLMAASAYRDIAGWMNRLNENVEEVIKTYRIAVDIYHNLGANDKEVLCLYRIRDVLYAQDRMQDYAAMTEEIMQTVSNLPQSSKFYQLLGDEMNRMNNYEEAVLYYEKAIDCYGELNKDNYTDYFGIIMSLQGAYFNTNRFSDANRIGQLRLDLNKKYEINETPYGIYNNLYTQLVSYFKLGDIEKGMACIEIAEQLLNNHPTAYGRNIPLMLKIEACNMTGDYKQMLEYTQKSDSTLAAEFDEINEERLSVLNYRIGALSWLDRYQEATALLKHLLQIKQPLYRNDYKEYCKDLRRLANMEAFSGVSGHPQDMDSAKVHLSQYARLEEDRIRNQAPWLTSMQRNALWRNAQEALLEVTGFATNAGAIREPLVEEVYNANVLAKGLLLQTERAFAEAIQQHGTSDEREALGNIGALYEALVVAEREQEVTMQTELKIKIQTAENLLIRDNTALKDYMDYLDVDFKSIHSALHKGEVLVDFLEVKQVQQNDKSVCAFIIRPEWEYPHLMRVCRYSEIDQIAPRLNARLYEDSLSCAFRHLALDSVLQYVNPGERLYYVPDGLLHGVALENLKTDNGQLLSEVYDMRRVSSARQIALNHTQAKQSYRKATLYGALDYGSYDTAKDATPVPPTPDSEAERGVGDAYEALRATEYEIKTIDSILKKSKFSTTCYRKTDGTEESFRAIDGSSPDIIHLATHGYYLTQEQALKVKGLAGYSDPMQLSGLVMSGGNAGWLNVATEGGAMDGLLSAQDIAGMDLSNTKLVVLSACKTAGGQTKADGIFGLQRAFKKAGAGSLLMTLWGVNDEATAMFMTAFYQQLVKNGWDHHRAYEEAKSQIRHQRPEPYYWAGFVLLD